MNYSFLLKKAVSQFRIAIFFFFLTLTDFSREIQSVTISFRGNWVLAMYHEDHLGLNKSNFVKFKGPLLLKMSLNF